MLNKIWLTALATSGVLASKMAFATTLSVGPGKSFTMPCQAFSVAKNGDIVEIDAANYSGDVCGIYQSSLVIRGKNGRAVIDAAGRSAEGKAIWVIKGSNVTVENIEFKNAKVADRNGAGIRHEGTGLTIRNSFFHHNENGILSGANPNNEILIERSEFSFNGAGDGYSHNIYIGKIKKFSLIGSFSHDSKVGHLVKSRAQENHIKYNRLTNETGGTSSYEIDLPNGGRSYIIGNVLHQSAATSNSSMLSYAMEGATNTYKDLYVINNTFVSDRSYGYFLRVQTAVTTAPIVKNNVFAGAGQVFNTTNVVSQKNYAHATPAFVNRSAYDYRPAATAAFINAGVNPGASATTGVSLVPTLEYVQPLSTKIRPLFGVIDIGAFEYVPTR